MSLDINDYREMERQRREFGQCDPVTWSKVFASLDPATPGTESFGNFYWGIGHESYSTALNRFFTDAAVRAIEHDLKNKVMSHVDQVLEGDYPLAQIEAVARPRTEEEKRQGYSWTLDITIYPPYPKEWERFANRGESE